MVNISHSRTSLHYKRMTMDIRERLDALRNEEDEPVCEVCGGGGELYHSDYYCDMAYTTPCYECNAPPDE